MGALVGKEGTVSCLVCPGRRVAVARKVGQVQTEAIVERAERLGASTEAEGPMVAGRCMSSA